MPYSILILMNVPVKHVYMLPSTTFRLIIMYLSKYGSQTTRINMRTWLSSPQFVVITKHRNSAMMLPLNVADGHRKLLKLIVILVLFS